MRRFAEKMMKRATYIKFLFFLISIMLFSCVKDASIGKAILCNNPSNNQCNEDIASFYGVETDTIHLFVTLNNAPKNIKVDITWYYQAAESEKEVIMQGNFEGDDKSNIHAKLYTNTPGWPVGEYSVIIKIVGSESEAIEKKFIIK